MGVYPYTLKWIGYTFRESNSDNFLFTSLLNKSQFLKERIYNSVGKFC